MKPQSICFNHFFLCFFTFFTPLSSTAQNFARIDSLAVNTPIWTTRTAADLSAYCDANAVGELEKVRFYYVWIARNIRYDEKAYGAYRQTSDYNVEKQSVSVVLSARVAVCRGYALLLERLCRQSNMAVRYVAGYGKSRLNDERLEPHAWNVVRIEGNWELFDPTWASNSLQRDSSNLSVSFEKWFMTPPVQFARQHWAYDPVFQLTDELTSRAEFLGDTEGSPPPSLGFDVVTTLNIENSLDSLEATWRSYNRAHLFSPTDSIVAQKLARLQDEKAKATLSPVDLFTRTDFKRLPDLTIEELKTWIDRLEKVRAPAAETLLLHAQIDDLPLRESDILLVQKNRRRLLALAQFLPRGIQFLEEELSKR
ncbi:MAG: transglutaminase domain-containing protein [Saprospiraceae bacterium]|nr:transglutaminase domain-containing protein [Saprospiraceae bacterium]